PKKKVTIRNESSDEESDEQEERLIRSKPMGALEFDTQKAIKDIRRETRFQHQSGGLSEGAGLGLEGSTDDVTFPFDEKDEKVEDIPWVSTDDDETEDDDEEDDTSIDIEKTDDERMDIDVEDQVKGVAEINIAKEEEEENEEKVEEQNADEEQKGE
ncbi:hypothetical protein Tco_0146673, partial [Tanacetum coccineum]